MNLKLPTVQEPLNPPITRLEFSYRNVEFLCYFRSFQLQNFSRHTIPRLPQIHDINRDLIFSLREGTLLTVKCLLTIQCIVYPFFLITPFYRLRLFSSNLWPAMFLCTLYRTTCSLKLTVQHNLLLPIARQYVLLLTHLNHQTRSCMQTNWVWK
jgi:hypothetical protein